MTASTAVRPPPQPVPDPKPMVVPGRSVGEQVLVKIFVLMPFIALIAAVPIAWGWGSAGPISAWPPASTSSPASG